MTNAKLKTLPIQIIILGAGNVAFHLHETLKKCDAVNVLQVYNRHPEKLDAFSPTKTTTHISELEAADIYIIAVKDDAIATVSKQLETSSLVVHTSGGKAITELQNNGRKGVFYPLQSFTKGVPVNFSEVPICIEAQSIDDQILLKCLAQQLSGNIYELDSGQRELLHVSAVFVNNFTNHIYRLAEDLCKTNNIPFSILHPLLLETARKATVNSPSQNQTGPAQREDSQTIYRHKALLRDTEHRVIYEALTKAIQDYGKKL